LRPSAAPAPGLVGVTRSQLKKLLAQLSTVSTSNSRADIDALSDELFRQLSNGEAVDLAALVAKPGKASQQHLPPPSSAGRIHTMLGVVYTRGWDGIANALFMFFLGKQICETQISQIQNPQQTGQA